MKKLSFVIVSLLAMNFTMGQSIVASSYMEKTSVSPKAGISVGMRNHYGIEYGGFYQDVKIFESALMSEEQMLKLPRRYERVFWGGYVAFPLIDRKYTDLKFSIRTGIVNSESFVITPSLLAAYEVAKGIKVGGGLGVRSFRPTFQTSVSLSI